MNFSSFRFGYVAMKPANTEVPLAVVKSFMDDGNFNFLKKDSTAIIHAVAFGSCHTYGNEKRATPILERVLPAVGQSINAFICVSVSAVHGLLTVTTFSLS